MKVGMTELVMILDRSGSMAGLEADTIGGYNAMLKKQQAEEGHCLVTTVLFDSDYELIHHRIDISAVSPITAKEYSVGGTTALLDAVGSTIHKIKNAQKHNAPQRAAKVIFVIITDGKENSSREYAAEKVKALVEQQKIEYGWEFIFLGANLDAVKTAARFGISRDRAQNYHADSVGVALNFESMNSAVTSFRQCKEVPADWNKEIRDDYQSRSGKK